MANPAAAGHDDRTRSESAYLAANDAAMSQMMKSMAVTLESGNVDRDFVAMMVPHHQGAIDMARAVLEYGTDERTQAPRAGDHRHATGRNHRNETYRRYANSLNIREESTMTPLRLVYGSMRRNAIVSLAFMGASAPAFSGQAPGAAANPDVPLSHHDRVYAAEQFSNTVSITDPADNTLLGVIRLGDPQPANFTPLYRGQVLVHGLGFSWDHKDDCRRRHRDRKQYDLHRHCDELSPST